MQLPTYDSLLVPALRALQALGGSGSNDEIYEKVVEIEGIPEEVTSVLHDPERSNTTEVAYRLAWARTYLKKFGLIDNSARGVWALASSTNDPEMIDPQEIVRFVRNSDPRRASQSNRSDEASPEEAPAESPEEVGWQSQLHHILTKQIDPAAFERLTQRLLRESGFLQVEVTGRTGDGGIDGKGIARIHGFMSFHVYFQCKKYQGSVSASEMRDFRGAMVGRADKGLFITTGSFTAGAIKEATREGAPPIDLADGEELARKLKELSLGITTQLVEQVAVNEAWFKSL